MRDVLGRPRRRAVRQPAKVLLRDRPRPAAAVLPLAAGDLRDDEVGFELEFRVAGRLDDAGGGGKPVSHEMPAYLAGGRFPTPVMIGSIVGVAVGGHAVRAARPLMHQPGFLIEAFEQVFGAQAVHVAAVQVEAVFEQAGQQLDLTEFKTAGHDQFFLKSGYAIGGDPIPNSGRRNGVITCPNDQCHFDKSRLQ